MSTVLVAAAAAQPRNSSTVGSSPREREEELLRKLASAFPDRQILRQGVVPPPSPFQAGDALLLSYTVRDTPGDVAVKGRWEANIVSGQFRKIAAERHWPFVKGQTINVLLPSGKT